MRLQQNPELRAACSPRKRMILRYYIYVSNIGTSTSFETPPEMVIVRAPAASSSGMLAFEAPLDILQQVSRLVCMYFLQRSYPLDLKRIDCAPCPRRTFLVRRRWLWEM